MMHKMMHEHVSTNSYKGNGICERSLPGFGGLDAGFTYVSHKRVHDVMLMYGGTPALGVEAKMSRAMPMAMAAMVVAE